MSERNLKISEVKRMGKENDRLIKLAQDGAGTSNSYVVNYRKQITKLEEVHKLRLADLESRLERVLDNAKTHHDNLEALLSNKESIHKKLKKAIHFGEVQCEHCGFYYTERALERHLPNCSSRPDVKVVSDHKAEMKAEKATIEARKAQLKKELEALEKKSEKERIAKEKAVKIAEDKAVKDKLRADNLAKARAAKLVKIEEAKVEAEKKAAEEAALLEAVEKIEGLEADEIVEDEVEKLE